MQLNEEQISFIRKNSQLLEPIPSSAPKSLTTFSQIKAIIFDVYGTLFISGSGDIGLTKEKKDTDLLHKSLENSKIEIQNSDQVNTDDFYNYIIKHQEAQKQKGIQYPEVEIRKIWKETLSLWQKKGGITTTPLTDDKIESLALNFEVLTNPVWPMPGVRRTLNYLKEKNLLLGIISNAQFYTPILFPALLDQELTNFGFKEDLCFWSYKEGVSKPDTHSFKKCLSILANSYQTKPEETLFIGNDLLKDIMPAQNQGMKTAILGQDNRSYRPRENEEACKGVKADAIFSSLEEVIGCLS